MIVIVEEQQLIESLVVAVQPLASVYGYIIPGLQSPTNILGSSAIAPFVSINTGSAANCQVY